MKKNDLGALFYPGNVPFDSLFIPYIYKEIYFESIYTDIVNQRRDMVIVDVGANIGIVTQYLRDYAKKVYAIEPSSEHFQALAKNKEFNHWDNVEVFKVALADQDGEMQLNLNLKNRTCHSLTLNYGQDGEKVETMKFNTFFKKNKIKQVDFVKFDVEGAEDMILRSEGFRKVASSIKAIMVEFHFPTWMQLVEYMGTLGYQARRYQSSAIIVLFTRP